MPTLIAGTEVKARGLRWEVVFTQAVGEQELYRLRCLEGGLRGHEFDLLAPFEVIEPVASDFNPQQAARLQQWRVYHQAFLLEQALGPTALLAAQPGRLRIAPYQLVPVMRALRMSRPRLLLADGVGLGKTVEAGFVLAELIARRRAHRILIVSPAGPLLRQWQQEMRQRFGLRFAVLDREKLQEIRYQQELGANPFDHEALGLISIDFAKQEKILQDLERTQYDVVVIDEAHHCTRLGTAGNQEDSQRRRLAEVLSRRTDSLLLLTATPHDGYDPHFASLIELLDPSLVDGRGSLRGEVYRRHVIRRLKRHIKDPDTGELLFKERRVSPYEVVFTPQDHPHFAAFQEALLALVGPQLQRALRQRRYGDVLAFISLLKRSVSTVAACKKTLETIGERLATLAERGAEDQETRRQRLRSLRDYRRRLERFGVLPFEEEQDQAALEAEDMAAELLSSGADELLDQLGATEREVRRERDRLRRLTAIRDGIRHLGQLAASALPEDPKLVAMVAALQDLRAREPEANVLIYTEYADSQETLVATLRTAVKRHRLTGDVLAISGADDEATRIQITERFSSVDNLILVSTDATAEGLNLQARCHHLIHLELPYNPNRLEQRNGRIDRFGQTHEPQVRYLYLTGTFEERLLLRLVAKYEKQRARLSFVPNTLGILAQASSLSTVKLLEGIADEPGRLFTRPEHAVAFGTSDDDDVGSPFYRDLLDEVEKAFSGFERAARTHDWLGEVGLHADERLVREAAQARAQGHDLGVVELLDFVLDAVRADATDPAAVTQRPDGVWELRLPSNWIHGLEELPGYDAASRCLRLTTEIARTHDGGGQALGYLGRAHPLVRRALDRVRHIQFGSGGQVLDRRVSVAQGDAAHPELLCTFLCRVQSAVGREFERVMAVRVSLREAPEVLADHATWAYLLDTSRARPTAGQWERLFASWGMQRLHDAAAAAQVAFADMADAFAAQQHEMLVAEQQELDQWRHTRTEGLCGPPQREQPDLFRQTSPELPRWQTLLDDAERLAAFATDQDNSPRARSEAQMILNLWKQRVTDLDKRRRLEPPEVTPLGMLMLVPDAS